MMESDPSNTGLYLGICIMLCLLGLALWAGWWYMRQSKSIEGTWTAYNAQKVKGGYDWKIIQKGSTLDVFDANMPNIRAPGTIIEDEVTVQNFKLKGTFIPKQNRINWADGNYWLKN